MTTGRARTTGAALERFPEFPPRPDMQNLLHLHDQGHVPALKNHFGNLESTLVLGEVPVGWNARTERSGIRILDLIVAFNINRAQVVEQMGYSINEQGKPPDFVLEVASYNTAMNDERGKRTSYAGFGIPEYWRFDPSGGQYYEQPLAGDRLGDDGSYHPIPIRAISEEVLWGYSEKLGLYLCWEHGQLRWHDPASGQYLKTYTEEQTARIAAEARIRELEAELERRRQQ